jgi:hypothetical protein
VFRQEKRENGARVLTLRPLGTRDGLQIDYVEIQFTKPIKPAKPGLRIIKAGQRIE